MDTKKVQMQIFSMFQFHFQHNCIKSIKVLLHVCCVKEAAHMTTYAHMTAYSRSIFPYNGILRKNYLRNKFHFCDIHRSMNSMGPMQSK